MHISVHATGTRVILHFMINGSWIKNIFLCGAKALQTSQVKPQYFFEQATIFKKGPKMYEELNTQRPLFGRNQDGVQNGRHFTFSPICSPKNKL